MSKTTHALYKLVSQFFDKSDETSLVTNSQLFRHAAATPLTGLMLNLELANANQQNPYLADAVRQAERLKQLFELSEVDLTKSRSFRVLPTIREILLMLKSQYRASLLKEHLVISTKTRLEGNYFLFQEALVCTLKNALESYRTDQQKIVMLRAIETDDQVIISVSDGGRGFTTLQRSLAFADGFSTKKGHQGLGMTYVKRVVKHHFGGKLTLTSKPNHGSTITWYLPKPTHSNQ